MKKKVYYLFVCFVGIITMALTFIPYHLNAQTAPLEIKIVTGNEMGEYYSLAKDLEKLSQTKNFDIDVIPTRGALQNIQDVYSHSSITLGITQNDAIAFLNTFGNNNDDIRRKAESIRTVMPLYKEEIHLVTRREIKSIDELTGKIISIGEEGSGTSSTSATILYHLGINPKQMLTLDTRRGIDALRNKEIDGFFYVVGIPSNILEAQIFPEDNFHLLPISLPSKPDDEFLSRLYPSVTIPANTYSWQKDVVETLSVQSLLFTTVDQDCKNVTPVVKLIKENLVQLQQFGNPLWKKVTLDNMSNIEPDLLSVCATF